MAEIKQYILSGVTRVPDNTSNQDGQLHSAVNLANDGAGLQLLEKPQRVLTLLDGEQCIYIHETHEGKHYILLVDDSLLVWVDIGEDKDRPGRHRFLELDGEFKQITSLGNTLIITDESGTRYALWRGEDEQYDDLGNKPPFIEINFGLDSEFSVYPKDAPTDGKKDKDNEEIAAPAEIKGAFYFYEREEESYAWSDTNSFLPAPGCVDIDNLDSTPKTVYELNLKNINTDAVKVFRADITAKLFGYINTFIAEKATNLNKFVFPFYVRYAYELFDGSLIMHSYPVLMVPNTQAPVFIPQGYQGLEADYQYNDGTRKTDYRLYGRFYMFISQLRMRYKIDANTAKTLEKWKDIIKGINVYITPEIYTLDQEGEWQGWEAVEPGYDTSNHSAFVDVYGVGDTGDGLNDYNNWLTAFKVLNKNHIWCPPYKVGMSAHDKIPFAGIDYPVDPPYYRLRIPQKDTADVRKALRDTSQFFKVLEIELDDLTNEGNAVEVNRLITNYSPDESDNDEKAMEKSTLKTLTTRQQMQDDYHTHDILTAEAQYVYNRRLDVANISRSPHTPISPYVQWQRFNTASSGPTKQWRISIHLRNNSTQVVSYTQADGLNDINFPLYIFYPDASAYKAELYDGTQYYSVKLEEHPYLEGAYWISNFLAGPVEVTGSITGKLTAANGLTIDDTSMIMTSEAENPFYFKPDNVNNAGDGIVRALCANTEALGASQFGEHPMYCFTNKGVWALSVHESTGGFKTIQPVTRDVITEGTKPIGTDDNVLFFTSRGLLQLAGVHTRNISAVLDGEVTGNFNKLSKILAAVEVTGNTSMVSPDVDRFWLSSNARMVYDYRHARVYIDDGSGWSWVYNLKSQLWSQSQTYITTPLNSYPEAEFVQGSGVVTLDTAERYSQGIVLTRPLKTGGEWLSKVREITARGNFAPRGKEVAAALFGSRDWHEWGVVGTSTINRITRLGGSPYKSHCFLAVINASKPQEFALTRLVAVEATEQTNKLR